jgi:hypothetical protein
MDNATIAQGLREYADFLETHPDVTGVPSVSIYGVRTTHVAIALVNSLPSPSLDEVKGYGHCRILQRFGAVDIEWVVNKEAVYEPAIIDGAVSWSRRPGFSFSEVL